MKNPHCLPNLPVRVEQNSNAWLNPARSLASSNLHGRVGGMAPKVTWYTPCPLLLATPVFVSLAIPEHERPRLWGLGALFITYRRYLLPKPFFNVHAYWGAQWFVSSSALSILAKHTETTPLLPRALGDETSNGSSPITTLCLMNWDPVAVSLWTHALGNEPLEWSPPYLRLIAGGCDIVRAWGICGPVFICIEVDCLFFFIRFVRLCK